MKTPEVARAVDDSTMTAIESIEDGWRGDAVHPRAPCGAECTHATRIAASYAGDYVWCSLRGAPQSTNLPAVDCQWFSPREKQAASFGP
jgi:hypothetical protein